MIHFVPGTESRSGLLFSPSMAARWFRRGTINRWWLLGLFVSGLSSAGWGQCFQATTVPLTNLTTLVGNGPRAVAVGDFNADGRPDLVTANQISNNVAVLLGNGSGGFGAATSFPVGSSPESVVVRDFNADGRPDLAVANQGSNNVSVLLGNGIGGFRAPTNFAVGNSPVSMAVGDFNADGRPDLAVTNGNSSNVSVLLGNGSGGFGTAANFTVSANPYSVAVRDFNGDGRLDLVTANFTSNNVSVLLGNGSGGFGAPTNFTVGIFPISVVVGDFNADGRADLATANFGSNNVAVLLGNGSGGFGTPTKFTVGNSPSSVAVGDFNGDGRADLTTANIGSNNISVLLGNGSGGFGAATNFTVGEGPNSVAVGDFNADGRADLTTANYYSNNVSVLSNCTIPVSTAPLAITGVTTVSCQVVTAGLRRLTFTPRYARLSGQPVSFSVANELAPTTAAGPYSLNLYTDNPVIVLKAKQSGTAGEASFVYNWLAACNATGTPPTVFAITGVTTVSCATVTAGLRRVVFTPQYAALNGQRVSFSVANEMMPTNSAGPYTLNLYTDNPVISLRAVQSGVTARFPYNWLASCRVGSGARLGAAESGTGLQLRVLGNPVQNTLEVEVTGAEGAALNLSLTDMHGRTVAVDQTPTWQVGSAGSNAARQYRFDVSAQPAGVLLLRVSTGNQSKTVRILKVN